MGWGNVFIEEAGDLRRRFEEELNSDEEKLYKEWPQAFRWTCCGTDAGSNLGCDHHGSGSTPCTCDYCRYVSALHFVIYTDAESLGTFCRLGEPLPLKVYKEKSAARMGLTLRRGPDPRSSSR